MPRQPRLDLPGQFFHVMVRGVDRQPIFRVNLDREDFLSRLIVNLRRSGAICYTWALMTNHLHMLILSGAQGLATLMQPLLTGYVGAFNRRYDRVGHLVQNRYKAILCEEDPYFLELLRYIALNPVRAGIVKTLEALKKYPWTGHSALMGTIPLAWQAIDDVLGRFGRTIEPARNAYESFISDGWNQGHRPELEGGGLINSMGGIRSALSMRNSQDPQFYDARILGSGEFVERILKEAEDIEVRRHLFNRWGLTLEKIQLLAAQSTGIDAGRILQRDRSQPVADARALFIYAAIEALGCRATELARLLKMGSGSISDAKRRGHELSKKLPINRKIAGL